MFEHFSDFSDFGPFGPVGGGFKMLKNGQFWAFSAKNLGVLDTDTTKSKAGY